MLNRKVHIDDQEWTYKIGSGAIVIWSPEGKKHLTNQSVVTGMSWDDLERGKWKGTWKGIGPKLIKEHIEKHILTKA